MSDNGAALDWSGKLFSAEDLRRHWHGQRELVLLPRALVTPLALDELRARGITITRQARVVEKKDGSRWAYAQEHADAVVAAAVAALEREGLAWTLLEPALRSIGAWVRANVGSVVFTTDAARLCCLANKLAGLRAAAVTGAEQTRRALASFGANVLVVEMPGRNFFEVRQILKTAAAGTGVCPAETVKLLEELEGHAHR
jgi:hypothetical protein